MTINTGSVVKFHIPANLPLSFLLNCFQNGKSCFLLQLTGLIDICQMLTDGGYLNSKKLGHGLLSEPDSFVFYENIDLYLAVGGGVEEEVGLLRGEVGIVHGTTFIILSASLYLLTPSHLLILSAIVSILPYLPPFKTWQSYACELLLYDSIRILIASSDTEVIF